MSREAPTTTPRSGVWATVRRALRGSEDEDYTRGSVGGAIVLLAVPMVLEMMMESAFAITDVFFVSRLGIDAVATVGFTEAMVTILFAVAIGLAMSTTAMVARRIGEKDREGAAVAAVQAMGLGTAVSIVVAVAGIWQGAELLRLMGGSPELVASGSLYTRILLGGNVTIMLIFIINAVFRGAGDAAVALRTLTLANGCNILLDPCLIFGLGPFPELGLPGAAVATTIGRGIGVTYQLTVLFRGSGAASGSRIRIGLSRLRLVPPVMGRLLRVSLGGIGQFLIATSSWIGLVWIVGRFGSPAVAGYTIAIRIVVFALLPSWGLANAAATLMGQNLGAGQPDRAERSVWTAALYNLFFLLTVAVVFIAGAPVLVGIFTSEPEVLAYGISCLRYVSYGYGFYAYGMVMVQAFNGAGDTRTPTWINFFCHWLFQLPLAWFLAEIAGLGARGVFGSITITESVTAVVGVLVFRRGRWRTQEI